jgi:hypothetical protein
MVRRANARFLSGCESRPARSLQPVANGAVAEVNEAAEASGVEGHVSDFASMQAVT